MCTLSNQKYKIQPTLINLRPNKYSQALRYYPFTVKLDGCNTLVVLLKIAILLMTYVIKYVFQIKQKI